MSGRPPSATSSKMAAASEKSATDRASSTHSVNLQPPPAPVKTEEASEFTLQSILVLVGAATATFNTVGMANSFGVYQQYYFQHLLHGHSNSQIAWIGSVSTFMLFGFAAPAGIVGDKIGPRPLLIVGAVLELISVFMLSLCTKYYQVMLAQGVLQGFSFSLFTLTAAAVPMRYFKKYRAVASGVTVAGSSLGGIIFPIALDQFLNVHHMGFGPSVRILGYIMIPLALITILTVKLPAVKPVDGENQLEKPAPPPKDYAVLRSMPVVFLYVGLGFAYLAFFVPLYFVSTYAVVMGVSESFSFYYVSIANTGSFLGRIIPSLLADRTLGYSNSLIISLISSALVTFCWTAAKTTGGIAVWILAYGFTSGAIMSLQFTCCASLAGPHMAGAAIGISMTANSIPALVSGPIAGAIEPISFTILSCYTAALLLVAGILVAISRFTRERTLMIKM